MFAFTSTEGRAATSSADPGAVTVTAIRSCPSEVWPMTRRWSQPPRGRGSSDSRKAVTSAVVELRVYPLDSATVAGQVGVPPLGTDSTRGSKELGAGGTVARVI